MQQKRGHCQVQAHPLLREPVRYRSKTPGQPSGADRNRPQAVRRELSEIKPFHKEVSHFAHLCRRCRNIVLTEPVQTDKCVNRSQVPFVRRLVGGDP